MDQYKVGHVKRDPETNSVAVRSIFHHDLFPAMYWLVASVGSGGNYVAADHCNDWDDLYTPEV